jgi:large subunit ribosomal protein L10
MATKAFKAEKIEAVKAKIAKAKVAIVTENKGLSVAKITELRRNLQKENGDYTVIKNTLAKLAIEGTEFEPLAELLTGPVVLALGFEDQVSPAKVIAQFTKDKLNAEKVTVKGGCLDGKLLDAKEVDALAKLPSKEELYAKMLGCVNSPASGIANATNGVLRALVYAMDQVRQQKTA